MSQTKTKTLVSKVLIAFLAIVLTAGTLLPASFMLAPESYAAENVQYKHSYPKGIDGGLKVVVNSGSIKGYVGYCGDALKNPPASSGTATSTRVANNTELARVAYYVSGVKTWHSNPDATNPSIKRNGSALMNREAIHYLLAYTRVANKYKTDYNLATFKAGVTQNYQLGSSGYKQLVNTYKAALNAVSKNDVPNSFRIYYLKAGTAGQDFFVFKYTPPGSVAVNKTSTDSSYTTLPGYNSFDGITYGVYKSDKSTKLGTLTVNSNGSSNAVGGLDPETTYYIKEETSNAYYGLDPNWHAVTAKSNKTNTVTLADPPNDGYAQVIKKEARGNDIEPGENFTFRLTHVNNSSMVYPLTVTGNGTATASGTIQVPAGTYNVVETSMPKNWVNQTGTGQVVV